MERESMCRIIVLLLYLTTFTLLSCAKDEKRGNASCQEPQKAFGGSCFEFVDIEQTFYGAQAWCEQSGGHLAFIPDEETQHFLQRHLNPKTDVWIGVAPSTNLNLQFPPGPLSWLDDSPITYSKWLNRSQSEAACGHILKDSDFHWKATKDCNKKQRFICQFEYGRSIMCAGHHTTLQCGSGHLLMFDGGFYGRKNMHYCQATLFTLVTPTQQQCGWVDALETLTAHCQGRQVCQTTEVVDFFGEPCPQFGSYLSVEYHCKKGLTLSVSPVAAVHDVITIRVKWLLDLPQGHLSCMLNTGDGHVIYLRITQRLGSNVTYTYSHPGTFVNVVKCSHGDILVMAQEIIAIQEAVTEFGPIRCYSEKLFFHASNCKALEGKPFQIQMEVKTGTNVTYRIQRGETLLADFAAAKGNIPQNVTVRAEMVKQLGPGCHQLTLYASNSVPFPETSADLKVCVLEKVTGLQASVLNQSDCEDSSHIPVGVSLQSGAPALLLFFLTWDNISSSEMREMKKRSDFFYIGNQIESMEMLENWRGAVKISLRAWNIFSFSDVDVSPFSFCGKNLVAGQNSNNDFLYGPHGGQRKRHVRVDRSAEKLIGSSENVIRSSEKLLATTVGSIPNIDLKITLSAEFSEAENTRYEWTCNNPCKCQGSHAGTVRTIEGGCIPDPFQFNKYHFNVIDTSKNKVEQTEVICITYTPTKAAPYWLRLWCSEGCNPIEEDKSAKIKMFCLWGRQCPQVEWYIEDPRNDSEWPEETKNCYEYVEQKPLTEKKNGGTEYTVNYSSLKEAKKEGVTVVITYVDGDYYYKKYHISTSSQESGSSSTGQDNSNGGQTSNNASSSASPATTKSSKASTPGNPSTSMIEKTTKAAFKTENPVIKTTPSPGVASTTSKSDKTTKTNSDSNTPAITTKTNTSPAVTTKNSGTPAVTTRNSETAATTKNSETPAITTETSDTTSPATNILDELKCSILPRGGTILDAFTVTCSTVTPCSNCRYCFKTQEGKHLRCTDGTTLESVFLPLGDQNSNYKLIIKAEAKYGSFEASTTITTKVSPSSNPSGGGLSASVEKVLDQLKEQGQLTGETIGQICNSVSSQLNSESDESNKAERQKLREQMLSTMTNIAKKAPTNSPEAVQVMTRGLIAVSQKGSELSSSAQEEASLLLAGLSSSLLHMDLNKTEENKHEVQDAASTIVEGAGNTLYFSPTKNTSDALLGALDDTMSALLAFQDANEGPTIIQQPHISVLVNRVTPGSLHKLSITIPNCSCSSFSLPALPLEMLPSDSPVDIRMMSLDKNPFSWNDKGNISGFVGSLSLTITDGGKIPVDNLSEEIEILLPRPVGEQVNTSILDLGNFSTTAIDIPSANNTLVLKMLPSIDSLTFKVFLGYKDYPNETNHVAMTEMPHQGTTQEEKYTWLLEPETLEGNIGLHYLFVRPIVGPGIKSIKAKLSITPLTSSCKFWNESTSDWSTNGCRVGVQTTHLVTQCLCNHLTFFGSSFFVTPNLVDPSRTAELFATFAENPVVVCFVGALFVVYLLAVMWAWRKDVQDTVKVKVTVLEDNDPMDEYRYLLSVSTGHRRGAFTSSQVAVTLIGTEGNSEPHHLMDPKKCVFERGAVDVFLLTTPFSLGDLQEIRLWHNNSGSHPAWYVGTVMVQDLQTQQKWHFLCNSWLAIDIGDCSLDKVFPVSTEVELKRFSNLFFTKTTKDFSDGHLWYSVISRPPSSNFTCVQRVSCCFSLLLCTMLTSIMFYGIPTDPSEQTLDLGHFEFTWQQFMIGVQSSLIMFPVNILIVSIFRNTRPRDTTCCKRKDAPVQLSVSQTVPTNMNVTLDTVIKDITRISLSLSKTVKSNIPSKEPEFGPGQQVDINAILSVVEDFIKHNNKSSDSTLSSAHSLTQSQPTEATSTVHSGSTEEGIQKKSNKSQYLYRQLCHIERELTLLGPSGFPNPHSYNRAVQQVQGMKGSLEDQLFRFSSANLSEPDQKKLSPTDCTDADKKKKKSSCCHGGLPWWFTFVGWLLVIATSVVSGYFTMLYGLKFGKERSVSWLVSMIVSFFQSVLIIQPLKVVCLAIFFALVIKKVDEEEFQDLAFEENHKNQGDNHDQQAVRREGGLYAPPPAADIERMKRNKILEQKAFALIREILVYMGFMWMLLLVAYGQRDPNAFFLNRHIQHSFRKGTTSSMSLAKIFAWANTSLLENLFGVYPGFVTDGNSKLVGNARLRQLRVQRNSCQIADPMLGIVPECNSLYSWEAEDMGSYEPGWNNSAGENISISISSPWKYQTQAQLRAYPFWGKLELYRGGGFVVELGPDLQNASSNLEYLLRNKWLDSYTRAIFVEFTIYNANVNLFCIVTLLLETTAIGAFQFDSKLQSVSLYQSTGTLQIFVMAAEIIYMLFILHYMYIQAKLMKQQRWAYFTSRWNYVELTIILLSWSALGVYIKRALLGNRDVTYYQNHKDQFPSFYETAAADSVLQYLIAFLVLLSTIKMWHLFRLNPKMNLISATLMRAWSDISGFLLIIVIMVLAYSISSNMIYGWKLSRYRTLVDAVLTIISLQIGVFNYDEVLNSSPWLGGLLFGSCIIFMSYVVLNLLISVILVAFNQEQIHHKPSDEEEIVDLMLKKILSLFGIRYKNTSDTMQPDEDGDTDFTLNNSRNITNNSSVDVSFIHTSDRSENRL